MLKLSLVLASAVLFLRAFAVATDARRRAALDRDPVRSLPR